MEQKALVDPLKELALGMQFAQALAAEPMTFIVLQKMRKKINIIKCIKRWEIKKGEAENKRRPCCGQPQSYYLNVHCSKNRQLAVVFLPPEPCLLLGACCLVPHASCLMPHAPWNMPLLLPFPFPLPCPCPFPDMLSSTLSLCGCGGVIINKRNPFSIWRSAFVIAFNLRSTPRPGRETAARARTSGSWAGRGSFRFIVWCQVGAGPFCSFLLSCPFDINFIYIYFFFGVHTKHYLNGRLESAWVGSKDHRDILVKDASQMKCVNWFLCR